MEGLRTQMPVKAWLRSFGDMLSAFPDGQTPSPALLNDIQLVLDDAIFTVIAHGGQLPSFILEVDRLDAIHKRLGQVRMSELASQSLSQQDLQTLIPLTARLCSAFDAIKQRATSAVS
jgi:hypothetical protein